MKKTDILKVMLIFAVAAVVSSARADKPLKLATTTSTYDTGLLDKILPPFEKEYNTKVHTIAVGTGKAIKLGQNGDVDIILVHARNAEDQFVRDGYGVNRKDVMYNDFVLIGPEKDPAGIKKSKKAVDALNKIRNTKAAFVSRGDDSGTHKKEKYLWSKTKKVPAGSWYMETGQGMAASLTMANEKKAYILIDRGTYVSFKKKIDLVLLLEGDSAMHNPYGIISVNPEKHKHVNHKRAADLTEWITSKKCQKMISKFKKNGEKLFHPNASK